jgi:predicted nucleic acid-binding protein
LPVNRTLLPVQVLGELFNVMVRKGGFSRWDAADRVKFWLTAYPSLETTEASLGAAIDLATAHHFTIWDAVILCTAARAGCRVLLSEDMHDGFHWAGTTVVNPFSDTPNPLLAALLAGR